MARKAAVRRGRKNNDRPGQQAQAAVVPETPGGEAESAPAPEAPDAEPAAADATETPASEAESVPVPEPETPAAEPEMPAAEPEEAEAAPVTGNTEPMRIPAYLRDGAHTAPAPKRTLPAPEPVAAGAEAAAPAESEIDAVVRLQRDADEIAHRRQAEEAKRRRAEDKRRSADEEAYRRQAEEEAREREEIEERQRRVEEEQLRIRERVAREVEERTAAEERRLRREQEARIEEEVEKRLRQAEEEAVPQIIFSPKMERAKRATVLWIVSGIVVLALVSILLGIRNDRLRRQIAEQAQAEAAAEPAQPEDLQSTAASSNAEQSADTPAVTGERRVYLTFDDGPSPVTEQILDILQQYDVKATFFVVGRVDEASGNIYRRIVDEGHTLAMHSYTHNYAQIYESLDSFQADMHKLQNLLYEETGVWCKVFRFPGGSSNAASRVDMDELTAYLEREEITYYDWNVYGGDDISPDIMQSNVFANVEKYDNAVILLHDASDKEETVAALPGIIEYIQGLDRTVLLPITDETIPVQHGGETPDQ